MFMQSLINYALMFLVANLKGGAQATALALTSGQPVTAANISIGPNQHAVFTVQLVSTVPPAPSAAPSA